MPAKPMFAEGRFEDEEKGFQKGKKTIKFNRACMFGESLRNVASYANKNRYAAIDGADDEAVGNSTMERGWKPLLQNLGSSCVGQHRRGRGRPTPQLAGRARFARCGSQGRCRGEDGQMRLMNVAPWPLLWRR